MIAVQLSDDSISKTARRQQIIDGLHDIPAQIRKVLEMDKALQQLAKDTLAKEKSLLIMGRGYQCTSDVWIVVQDAVVRCADDI
jgi:glucosamine--fructose-6-phosphate aminotransferase (isomerizing)